MASDRFTLHGIWLYFAAIRAVWVVVKDDHDSEDKMETHFPASLATQNDSNNTNNEMESRINECSDSLTQTIKMAQRFNNSNKLGFEEILNFDVNNALWTHLPRAVHLAYHILF